jgi:exonuclease III
VGDFNTAHRQQIGHPNKKVSKEILDLNHTIDQTDLADVLRIFHPIPAQCTFFSVAHGTFSKMDHILRCKTNLRKYKKLKIIPCILSDHNALELEINNNKKKTVKNMQTIGS